MIPLTCIAFGVSVGLLLGAVLSRVGGPAPTFVIIEFAASAAVFGLLLLAARFQLSVRRSDR